MNEIIIDRDILHEVFISSLKGISCKELVKMMYSEYEAIVDFANLCNGKATGQKISMLFNPHRYKTKTKKSISIIEAFEKDSFLNGLARATLFKNGRVRDLLYQVLQLGINGVQYVNEFPPHKARNLFLEYKAKRILDPCSGWGGRMIGAASVGAFYHGFEPSSKTFNGLKSLGVFLKKFNTGFSCCLEKLPFEESFLEEEYDLAFTSPPYYDTEIYSDEETNSCNRYKTFEEWCSFFFFPMVEKMYEKSKNCILNLGCRKYPLVSVLEDKGFHLKKLNEKLSGSSGLGKTKEGAEYFYLVEKK